MKTHKQIDLNSLKKEKKLSEDSQSQNMVTYMKFRNMPD